MAQQTKNTSGNTEKKRGPGRPPGSKNKTKNSSSSSGNPTKQEVLDEMKRRIDRDKRNNDVIWSITLFAFSLFLFFTVVMDTTGSFGKAIHDVCNGLFGIMAFVLPFLVFLFAALLLTGKVRHISASTGICSFLIFVNMCILNSSRFIDTENLKYGFKDIADFYLYGVNGVNGGVIGMELGSLLAHFFGMPGLYIISLAVLIISIFLVANTPISRFAEKISNKFEQNRMLRELEADERRNLSDEQIKAAISADPSISADAPAEKKSFWKSVISGIIREEPEEEQPVSGTHAAPASAADIPKPFGSSRGTLFGKVKTYLSGIDSETGERFKTEDIRKDDIKYIDDPGVLGKDAAGQTSKTKYGDDRNFDSDDNYGYQGKKRIAPVTSRPGMGLGDPDDVGHSGSYGLDGHSRSGKPAASSRQAPSSKGIAEAAAGTPAAASIAESKKKNSAPKKAEPALEPDTDEDAAISAGFNSISEDSSYELPPVSLLKRDSSSKQMMSDVQLQERAELLEQTLNNFGVEAKVLKVTQGASVTRYEVQPATGVKVASITRLSDDIALNLRAKSIRIEAPIPGKAAVGIEVENDKPSPVLIRDLIDSEEFRDASSVIEFVVGKDISGNNIVADLKDMPHLLIAGATGSGKSVCINSIVTSFLYKARPSELKLIMIDPKVVELGNYNGIPHMLTPVVTDPRKASRALAIAVEEMDKRYELFAENNVKDLSSYNELMRVDGRYADCKPQIVIIIDELADLMMASPSEVENSICRLAQKARAAGMHLIVATQRPSVDVVTGLIKANIPSRIAFSVASQFDSRTILDMAGAEKLLGKGDMLFSPVGSTKPYRVQGPYISEKEIDKIIKFVKKEGGSPEYDEELKSAIENSDKRASKEPQDDLTEDVIEYILKSKHASVSMVQRKFRIGYNRAARIIDEIEEKGIIGPSDGSKPRQILVTEEEYFGGFEESDTEQNTLEGTPVFDGEQTAAAPEERLSNTKAMDSFNSLPESVRRMVMDADSESDY